MEAREKAEQLCRENRLSVKHNAGWLTAALLEASKPKWVSVAERLPEIELEDDERNPCSYPVLIWLPLEGSAAIAQRVSVNGKDYWTGCDVTVDGLYNNPISHWQEITPPALPAAPQEGE
jgi:hypothetical protein